MTRTKVAFFLFLLFSNPVIADEDKEQRRDKYVYRMIIETVALASNKELLEKAYFLPTFSGTQYGNIEVGIWYLQNSKTQQSKKYLAHLKLIYVGSHTGEVLSCAILERGKSMIKYLDDAKKYAQKGRCLLPESDSSGAKEFCLTQQEAIDRIDGTLAILRAGNKCEEDW